MANDEADRERASDRVFSFVTLSTLQGEGGWVMPMSAIAKPTAAEQVVNSGTGLATLKGGGGVRVASTGRSQRGFTLIETLVVVAILGFVAALAVVQINKIWQKARLKAEAGNLSALLQSAYTFMVNNRAPVFVRLVPGTSGAATQVTVTQNVDGTGTLFDTYTLPSFVSLSTTSTAGGAMDSATNWACACSGCTVPDSSTPGVLEIDTLGRTLNPGCNPVSQVRAAQQILMTHVNMIGTSPALTPKIVYTLQIFPVWKVRRTP